LTALNKIAYKNLGVNVHKKTNFVLVGRHRNLLSTRRIAIQTPSPQFFYGLIYIVEKLMQYGQNLFFIDVKDARIIFSILVFGHLSYNLKVHAFLVK